MTESSTWAVPQSSDSEGQASDFLQQLQDDAHDEVDFSNCMHFCVVACRICHLCICGARPCTNCCFQGIDLEQCTSRPAKRQRVYGSAAGQPGVPTPDVRDQHAQALPSMAVQAEGQGPLQRLTEDLVLRVLCFLSPEELAAAAPTCTMLRDCASQDLLWERHFRKRWDAPHLPRLLRMPLLHRPQVALQCAP